MYERNKINALYLFDKNEELIKIIPENEITDIIQNEKLNNLITLDIDLSGIEFEQIKNAEYVGHFDYNKDKFYLYRILNNRLDEISSIKAIHVFFDEMKSNGYIRDKRPANVGVMDALTTILSDTRWEVGVIHSDNLGTANWYDKTKLDAFSEFLNNWNVEFELRILFDGHKIYGRYVDIYNTRGGETGKRLVYGSNAIDIVAEEVKGNVYTALIGRGKGEEKFDESGEATGGYGRKINFKDVEWKKDKGDPLDKPLRQEFLELPEATLRYGFSNGKPRIRIADFPDCTDPSELLKLTYLELLKVSRPQLELSTEVERIGSVSLGDSVNIIRKDIDLYYTARVFEIERNLLDDNLTKIKLGDYIETNAEKKYKAYKDRMDSISNALNEFKDKSHQTNLDFKKQLQEGLEQSYYNDDGYNYELKIDNEYNLPAGYYSFDKPINANPSKVIYVGAGKVAISNSKKADGSWNWSTFGTGDGFVADTIVAGSLKGGKVKWNLETGEFLIGENADNFFMKFDGTNLVFGGQSLKPENMTPELKEQLKGEQGPQGTDATLPQWWHDWNGSLTTINGDYILTPRMYVGQSNKGVFFGNNVVKQGGKSYSGLVGYWSPDVTFHLDVDGSLTLGKTPGRQFLVDTDGNVTCPTITTNEIKGGAVTNGKLGNSSVTNDKLSYGCITADKIKAGEITTDLLIPGRNNRIVLESGATAGSVNAMSIDANDGAIRLKYDQGDYVRVESGAILFYVGGPKVARIDSGGVWTSAAGTYLTSDSRAKENIRFLDHTQILRENKEVEQSALNSKEIYNFVKNDLNFATYNFKDKKEIKISPVTQNIKNPDVRKILVGTDEDNKQYIEQYSYVSVLGVALKEALNKIDTLEKEIENLKGGIK